MGLPGNRVPAGLLIPSKGRGQGKGAAPAKDFRFWHSTLQSAQGQCHKGTKKGRKLGTIENAP